MNTKDSTGCFKTNYDNERGWMLNGYPVKKLRGTEVEINDKKYNINPSIQKVFTDKTYDTAKSMSDTEKLVFTDIMRKTDFFSRIPAKKRCRSKQFN